jgi:two-component system, cell cycle response regulator DivK
MSCQAGWERIAREVEGRGFSGQSAHFSPLGDVDMIEGKTVLMVEDQLDFLAVHKIYLERHGYRVLTAEDGHAAIEAARAHKPNIILLDYSVPMVDGIGVTVELKDDPRTCDIPIILLTAHTYGSVGRRAREAGCASFIGKPCEPRRVLDEIRKLIGASERIVH